ncbi:Protein CBG26160 [Caenorhabditis briggsae]|uniref:Protein CBG26160 n=1 Tax=Caenorhabditis briggsae TaxID=6238 RepID=B6IKW3_CAEBR|nr:Protein CBG26160 [Caenorhabditis briggsae]CAS00543.1 Protein CBG26160 [Caenorhabditis briggsae]
MEEITEFLKQEWLLPAHTCLTYTVMAFSIGNGCDGHKNRLSFQVMDFTMTDENRKMKVNEFISVMVMCCCVYQEAAVCKYYGHVAMFIAILIHQRLVQVTSQGGADNSCIILEECIKEKLVKSDVVHLGLLHYSGALFAVIYADLVWLSVYQWTGLAVHSQKCLYQETVELPIAGLVQFIGGFLCRTMLNNMASESRQKWIPFVYATLCTTSHYIIGVSGIHPMPAERCSETGCLTAGWLSSAFVSDTLHIKSIWRQKFEVEEANLRALESPESPPMRWVGRGNQRRRVPVVDRRRRR